MGPSAVEGLGFSSSSDSVPELDWSLSSVFSEDGVFNFVNYFKEGS